MGKDLFVSIVIVNWNGRKWLKDCLDSVLNQKYYDTQKKRNFEVIIVDNNSSDDSLNFILKNFGTKVKILKETKNFGFGVANNNGVEKSKGDILFFLNNDTKIEDNLFLRKLIEFKQNNKLNVVGPKITDLNGVNTNGSKFLGVDVFSQPGLSKHLFYIEGCALIIDKNVFIELGGFDKKYFMYSEDIDLCWRARLYGKKIGLDNEVSVIHFGGGSSEKTMYEKGKNHIVPLDRRYEVEKNNLRNLIKNYKIGNLFWVVPAFFLQNFLESIVYLLTGNFKMFPVILKATIWNIINLKDTLIERKIIQRKRIIDDNKILAEMNHRSNKFSAFLEMGLPSFK